MLLTVKINILLTFDTVNIIFLELHPVNNIYFLVFIRYSETKGFQNNRDIASFSDFGIHEQIRVCWYILLGLHLLLSGPKYGRSI